MHVIGKIQNKLISKVKKNKLGQRKWGKIIKITVGYKKFSWIHMYLWWKCS
jgi:hypothetical protein